MQNEWIDCKDRMPAPEEYVIVCDVKTNLMFTGRMSTKFDVMYCFEDTFGNYHYTATHWMPLPKLPEEQLKPCPFCGFTAFYNGILAEGHWAECSSCGCRTKSYNTKMEAGNAWNKRCNNG